MNNPTWSLEDAIEITLKKPDDFLKIKETLTRIGDIEKPDTLHQLCHILFKRGRYFIIHYKGMLSLDGNLQIFDVEDYGKQNKIALLLEKWELAQIVDTAKAHETEDVFVKVVSSPLKPRWNLVPHYTFSKSN